MTLTCVAYAKVNLYLHVTGKRDNGYHELDSLICFAQTGDQLSFEAADGLSLKVTGPMAPFLDGDPADNLVLKAAHGLRDLCGIKKGAAITLEKHLPVAAGIGGGSGDAAAALKGLCQLWNVFPDPKGLQNLALSLGADVPICLKAHAAHVGGIGEEITPLAPLPECWMVLVNPMVAVSTPAVFKARTGVFQTPNAMVDEYDYDLFISELEMRTNDLMAPALGLAPSIQDVLDALNTQDGVSLARMSGSGATCFALFAEKEAADRAEEALKTANPSWWTAMGKII
ncbi:4-(cytidine 5'-diphospho)-2-C-methyl-D-erythritol kinase [Terasakiella sp. A23]|uniref:4-(cytidine 5'-diphospho)-2-C-methyl-D-erythritol kinase n=1 Tax=Terasakiella sp. FCG-A23 TaxID=3080561 RepID=UPI002952DAC6|nr:4-(cytidine 5'-diphospho)-2-C-methyl-D-erythritol kinase [Terasakiella sp. A23]MDV7338226.1 4-(cytidine 5'-diphospho)-2-C-methyl-D-erythritol kinase [Terasakiella sp. A23]